MLFKFTGAVTPVPRRIEVVPAARFSRELVKTAQLSTSHRDAGSGGRPDPSARIEEKMLIAGDVMLWRDIPEPQVSLEYIDDILLVSCPLT